MYYCDECRKEKNWPRSVIRSNGKCEICDEVRECYDTPSKYLPSEKPKESKDDLFDEAIDLNMIDQIITFETAKLAKEKGYVNPLSKKYLSTGELCNSISIQSSGYASSLSAPTQSLLQRWLREEHNIDILQSRSFKKGIKTYEFTACFNKPISKGYRKVCSEIYEECLEKALKDALELIN